MDETQNENSVEQTGSTEIVKDTNATSTNKNLVNREVIGQQVNEWKTKAERLDIEYKKLQKKYSDLESRHNSTVEGYEWTSAINTVGLSFDDDESREVIISTLKNKYKKQLSEVPEDEDKPALKDWLKSHLETKPSYLKSFIPQASDKNSQLKVPGAGSHKPSASDIEKRKKEIAAMPQGAAKNAAIDKFMKDLSANK